MAVLSAVCPPMVGRSASGRFLFDDLGHDLRGDRLDIGGVGQARIGHDGRRIGIHQNHPDSLPLSAPCRPARPNSRIRTACPMTIGPAPIMRMDLMSVRLGIIRVGTVSQTKGRDIYVCLVTARPFCFISADRRTDNGCLAGRGWLPGWYCTENTGLPSTARPSTEPSNSERWVTVTPAGRLSSTTAKPWFWLVISTLPVERSLTGWLAPAMAGCHLEGFAAQGQGQHLMSETDAEQGQFRHPARPGSSVRRRRRWPRGRPVRLTGKRRRAGGAARLRPWRWPARRSRGSRHRPGSEGYCVLRHNRRRRHGSAGCVCRP